MTSSGDRKDYINYRFKRANESFEEALILVDNKRWNAVINRLYYSCFYAVIAVLIKNNIEMRLKSIFNDYQIIQPPGRNH